MFFELSPSSDIEVNTTRVNGHVHIFFFFFLTNISNDKKQTQITNLLAKEFNLLLRLNFETSIQLHSIQQNQWNLQRV